MSSSNPAADWPELPLAGWIDTRDTLQRWLQIVGKVRLHLTPPINHSWHSTLYLTARGLTTSPIPYDTRSFHIDLDFVDHRLGIFAIDGASGGFALEPQSVAMFYARLMDELARMGLPVRISTRPNELADATPFPLDEAHHAYDPDAAHRFWLALSQADRVLKKFRTGFIGKCSPVHLFWGAMDLAVTRFSGRTAPTHPGGIPNLPDRITREAYSHEVSSCGFWSGTAPVDYPAFYSYAYPQPDGFAGARVEPEGAFYSADFGEFILSYDTVRTSPDPDETLMRFLESTYAAAADLAKWDRRALEPQPRAKV
jgi:FAD/FMN-containing dehydrogenase